jgi:hypothetical protein
MSRGHAEFCYVTNITFLLHIEAYDGERNFTQQAL